jgi:signal transduction histidine kinase
VRKAIKAKEAQERIMPPNQVECIFESLLDGVIACDREGKIRRANTAALKLFEVASEDLCRGIGYQEFLHHYIMGDEPQQAISLEPWLMSIVVDGEAVSLLQLPSGRTVYVTRCSFPVLDARKQPVGTASVFHEITHRYQKALHLQRVHQAVSTLREAIAHIPEHLDVTSPEGIFLLSPPVLFVAQQLVDVIRQVLDCQHVSLVALGSAGRLYYAVGSGFTSEQEQDRLQARGCFLPSDFVDEMVKAVAAETMLVIDCLQCLYEQAETRARTLAQHEISLLINEFLNLASHELKTPLTAIKGNIQLAQRRLATLKRQLAEQPERVREQLEQVQHSLASATQSTRLEERIIKGLIDDARIQSHTLQLHRTRWDLNALLTEAVVTQQRLAPERTIVLESLPPEHAVTVMADAERITQVIANYLANALIYSPSDQPVTVQLKVEGAIARVSVHDEGPGIPVEEQGHIWGRFYYAKGITIQHELDLSLGLGLYLSRAFIERHQGSVGVQSDPGHGATFWFTLPVEAVPEERGEGRVI